MVKLPQPRRTAQHFRATRRRRAVRLQPGQFEDQNRIAALLILDRPEQFDPASGLARWARLCLARLAGAAQTNVDDDGVQSPLPFGEVAA
jgi:hypothetical protein